MSNSLLWRWGGVVVLVALSGCLMRAGELRIQEFSFRNGLGEVRVVSDNRYYYILCRGEKVEEIKLPADMRLGGRTTATMTNTTALEQAQFYRVEQVPVLAHRDTDGDGIDDVWELLNRRANAALTGTDAEADHNGNGVPDRLDYLRSTLRPGSARSKSVIAASRNHTLALRAGGELWGWGDNYGAQLGLQNLSETNRPTRIGTHSDWVSISAYEGVNLGMRSDGTLWNWGFNYDPFTNTNHPGSG